MTNYSAWLAQLPEDQQNVFSKCRDADGRLGDFASGEIEKSISERFRSIARARVLSPAVLDQAGTVTYGELDVASDRVAAAVCGLQQINQSSIGLLLPNDRTLLIALLGVWKSANIVALLDPQFPHQRIVSALKQTQTKLVISDRETISRCGNVPATWLDIVDLQLGDKCKPHREPTVEDAACIFFTSGSTGDPKAVVWSHRGLMHQTRLFTYAYGFSPADRLALLSSGGVNAVGSALIAILNGATLLPFDVRSSGVAALPRWLTEQRISICLFGTPLFRNLCETLTGDEMLADLRVIRLRSESVQPSDLALFKKHFPRHCLLVNGLSSSETGLLTLWYFDHDSELIGDEVPVGYPVLDKEILLLDHDGELVKGDQPGEIVVRSRYLAAGYWRRPDLTAQKFKPTEDGAARLCFTGDLGSRLPDGALLYRGRKDRRVKIRGYGVDIEEVEKTLRACDLLREATVVPQQTEKGESQLVAYFVRAGSKPVSLGALRKYLSGRLPAYMIPAAFVPMDTLPLTANGKIDRQALPHPGNGRPQLETEYEPPSTGIEVRLAAIWAEVLGYDRIGMNDDFFDLGGHSLAASRVVSRVLQTFRCVVPLRALFDSPTVAAMAKVIAGNMAKRIDDEKLELLLSEVEAMSEEEAQELVGEN